MKNINDFLFKVGKSVITAMDVNHDPNSTVSLHSDGSPVQTTLSLTFQEIEIQVSDDGGTERTEATGQTLLQLQENAATDPFGAGKRGRQ